MVASRSFITSVLKEANSFHCLAACQTVRQTMAISGVVFLVTGL